MTHAGHRWTLLSAGGLLVLLAVVWQFMRPEKPSHAGRPLSAWLDDLMIGRDGAQHELARQAIVSLGTNALPVLLHRIAAEEPRWYPLAAKVARAAGLRGPRSDALEQREQAERAFVVLGLAAQPAVPELQKMAREQPDNPSARRVLSGLEEAMRVRTHGPTTR